MAITKKNWGWHVIGAVVGVGLLTTGHVLTKDASAKTSKAVEKPTVPSFRGNGPSVWTDPEYGCQYLVTFDYITPRNASDGQQVCNV